MKVGFVSLGCSKNLIDTEMAIGLFKKNNFEIVNDVLSDFGTKVEVLIDQNNKLNEQDAKGYLLPYIKYLKIYRT